MIEIIKELEIEVSKPNVFQAIVAKQYDMNTRFLKVTFVDNKEKISINHSETVRVTINALRPDGLSKGFDGEINDDGTVTVPLHSWMLELVGTVVCDISVIDTATGDEKKLTTTSFTLFVEQAAWGGDGMTSDPQYDILIQLVNDCATARTNADIALEKSVQADAKYDACVEATERANEIINSSGFLEKIKDQNSQGYINVWAGTKEEYDVQKDNIPWGTYCIVTDDSSKVDLLSVAVDGVVDVDPFLYDKFVVKTPKGNIVYDKVLKDFPAGAFDNYVGEAVSFSYTHSGQYLLNAENQCYDPALTFTTVDAPMWSNEHQKYYYTGTYTVEYKAYSDAEHELPISNATQIIAIRY